MAGLLLALVIGAGIYWYSVWRHPFRMCKACGGSKKHDDQNFDGAWGKCHGCGGSGKRVRWGVRLLTPHAYRAIRGGKAGKNY